MCLILLATGAHPDFPLIVAANRDESYARPAAAAAFWADQPDIFGGRDLEQHGTWLALSRRGRFAAITNYRAGTERSPTARSRGELTVNFLTADEGPLAYLERVSARSREYNGFSLIVGEPARLFFYSNRGGELKPIPAGVHGLSNHLLDEPWPKVTRGIRVMESLLGAPRDDIVSTLFDLLADRTPAPDDMLPSTGVGLQRERDLSPSFIAASGYGTRASTVVLVAADGEVSFSERRFGAYGEPLGATGERFRLDPSAIRRATANPA